MNGYIDTTDSDAAPRKILEEFKEEKESMSASRSVKRICELPWMLRTRRALSADEPVPIKLQKHAEPSCELDAEECESLPGGDVASGERPFLRTF